MHTGCRWTGRLDGDVCFELRLPRADFRREQAGSVSTVAPTDDNIFVHRTCFRFTCCTTGILIPSNLQEYLYELTVHGIITRRPTIPFLCLFDPWLISSLTLLPSSLHFSLFVSLSLVFSWFKRAINQRIRGGNERWRRRCRYRVCIKNAYVPKPRVFRPRNSARRESLIITLGIKLGGQVC